MIWLLIYIAFAILVGMFAQVRRNRNGLGYFLVSLFISPVLVFLYVAILRELPPPVEGLMIERKKPLTMHDRLWQKS